MAILKGFPPSNTIQVDSPSKWICEMCGKEFWQSFPLSLCLDISDQVNYGILPCRECWSEDQGKPYWGPEKNKWGDHFTVYSKVREGHTYEELEKAHADYRAKCMEGAWPRIQHVRFEAEHLVNFEKFYKKINYKIYEDFWSPFRERYNPALDGWRKWERLEKEDVPQKLDVIGSERMIRMLWKQPGYGRHYNPRYYGLFRRDRWAWSLICNPMMPDKMNAVFVRDHISYDSVDVCKSLV